MLRRIWNSAVFWSFGVTGLRTGGFLLILPLIVRTLSSEELGLWYVLLGLVQATSLLELGFAPTIGRFTSYFMGGATTIPASGLPVITAAHAPPNIAGIAGLVVSAQKLYRLLGLAIGSCFFVLGGGWLAWRYPEAMNSPAAWLAFALLGAGTGFAMSQYFWGAVLAGMKQVREQQKIFFAGLVLNYAIVAAGILLGAGIFALVLGQVVLGLVPRWKARTKVREALAQQSQCPPRQIDWQILWPSTWRFYLTGACTYLSLPFLTLICAQITDLQTTASFGFSLQLLLTLHTVASCWQMVKLPHFSALRVAGRTREIQSEFAWRGALGVATFFLGAIVIIIINDYLPWAIGSQTPLLAWPSLQLMCLLVGFDCLIGLHAAVIQTSNSAPHLPGFLMSALLGVALGYLLGKQFAVTGILVGGIVGQFCSSLWSTLWLCWRDLAHPSPLSRPNYP